MTKDYELETKFEIFLEKIKRWINILATNKIKQERDKFQTDKNDCNLKLKKEVDLNAELQQKLSRVNQELIKAKENSRVVDLSLYKTSKTWKINGTNMLIYTWLKQKKQYEAMKKWEEETFRFNYKEEWDINKLMWEIRLQLFEFLGSTDLWTRDSGDLWRTVSETIAAKFKVDCEDMATFIHYLTQVIADKYDRPELKQRLFFCLGSALTQDGWIGGDHSFLVWKHTDEKYYYLESASSNDRGKAIKDSIAKFGKVDYAHNFRCGRVVRMSNTFGNYEKVVL